MAALAVGEGWQVHDANGRRKYLSTDERARFLRAVEPLSVRSRALCHVLAYAGCRVSEALALTLHHVDAERFTVTIRTLKRRKLIYRAVPVPQGVIETLKRLPTDESGRFWPMHRVTAWRIIKATMRRAGIAGPMACPTASRLRHPRGRPLPRADLRTARRGVVFRRSRVTRLGCLCFGSGSSHIGSKSRSGEPASRAYRGRTTQLAGRKRSGCQGRGFLNVRHSSDTPALRRPAK